MEMNMRDDALPRHLMGPAPSETVARHPGQLWVTSTQLVKEWLVPGGAQGSLLYLDRILNSPCADIQPE